MNIRNIFILIIFSCCQPIQDNKSLVIEDMIELRIKPDVIITPNPAYVRLIESDTGQFLFYLNHISEQLQFLNLESGSLAKEVELEFDGPNSMRNYTGIAALQKDRVWLTFSPPAIGTLSFEGEIQFKRRLSQGDVEHSYVGSNFHQELYLYEDKVFGMQPQFIDHHHMDKSDIFKHSLIYSYDIGSDKTSWYNIYYAEGYWDDGKKPSDASWARRRNKLYISPWFDHEIMVFDMQQERLDERVEVKSDHINNFYYVNEIPGSYEESLINRIGHDLYGILLYDKYRDCFYRFFYPKYSDDKEYPIKKLWSLHRSRPYTGIMVLDKDLNVMGEHVFEKFQVHTTSNIFVGEEGLYLSLNNENSPDFDENHLRYMVVQFDLEK